MRILVVGEYSGDHHQPSFCRGLRAAGADVRELHVGGPWRRLDIVRRAQMKYVLGPQVASLNARFLAASAAHKPDAVLAWSSSWLWPSTLEAVHRLGPRVVLYNNDDPFGDDRGTRLWRRFRALIPHADACFAYRTINLEDYRRAGARHVFLMRSWYSPEIHKRIELTADDRERFGADATFVGHYEDDGRLEALESLRAAGLTVRVFGGGWDRARQPAHPLIAGARHLDALHYAKAILASKVALVFLSKRNRDQYTRRCFEIPAMGALMIAPRTPELLSMYREGSEAAFYGSQAELVRQALRFVRDPDLRATVAAAGRARCLRDGHDAEARARQFLHDLDELVRRETSPRSAASPATTGA